MYRFYGRLLLFTGIQHYFPIMAFYERTWILLREQVVTSLTSGSWRKRRRWRSWRCPCQPSPSWTPGNCWGSWALAPWGKRRSSARLKRSPADLRGEQKGRSMNGVRMRRWMGVSVRSDAWCAAFKDANKHALFTHRQFFPGQTTSEG